MTKFSIKDIAFSGYRLLAAKPGAAVVWFVFSLLVLLGMTALTVQMAGPQMMALKEIQTSGQQPDPATMMNLSAQVFPVTLLSIFISLFTGSILMAAIIRAVGGPQQKGLGYLRLGKDEFRLFLVSLVLLLIWLVPIIVAYAGGTIGMFAAAGPRQAAMAMQGQGSLPVAAMVAAGAAAVPGLALFIWFYVKFSLSAPQTVAERQIRIFNSWTLTKGVFWRTLGTYVLAGIPAALGYVALMAALSRIKGGGFMQALQPDVSSMAAAFSGGQLAAFAAQALLQVIYTVALIVPATMIYKAVAPQPMELAESDDDDED